MPHKVLSNQLIFNLELYYEKKLSQSACKWSRGGAVVRVLINVAQVRFLPGAVCWLSLLLVLALLQGFFSRLSSFPPFIKTNTVMKISYVDVDFLSKYLLIYILFIYSFIYIKLWLEHCEFFSILEIIIINK